MSRRLFLLPVVLLTALALVVPGAAVAAEPTTTGYNQTPKVTEPKPSTGTSPSKESASPKSSTKEAEPSTSTAPSESAKTGTLPFTGFDLRWSVGIGLLLIGAGFSIVLVQRRQRREH